MSAGWRTLLLRIGDRCPEYGGSADHKEHIETCYGVLSREYEHSRDAIFEFLLQCAEQLPHKIPFFGVLIGLLNLENEDFAKDIVDTTQAKLQDALHTENRDRIRILLRFLSGLMCSKVVVPNSIIETFETLLSSAATILDEETGNPSWQPRADFYVYCILASLPWGGPELFEQVPDEFERVLVGIQSYISIRRHFDDIAFSVFETDEGHSPNKKDFIEDLWERIQILSRSGWKVKSVPKPHLSFEAQLVAGKSHRLSPISCPPPNLSPTSSEILKGQEKHEADLKYPQRLRRLHIFPTNKAENMQPVDRFVVEECILDVLLFFNGCRKECAFYLVSLPVSFRYEYLMAETIFSQLLLLPNPPFRPIYYTLVIIDLCKALPGAFPSVVVGAVHALFDRISKMDMECRTRLILWFSHHLSNFQFIWPWQEWSYVKDLPKWAPQRVFVQEVLEREIRLSYFEKIKQSIEDAAELEELLPPKAGPNFKFLSDESNEKTDGHKLSKELVGMVRGKKNTRDIILWVEEQIIPTNGAEFALDVVIQTLLDIGSKSFTHLITVLERYGQIISKLCPNEEMQLLLMDEVSAYWKNSTQMTAIAIDRMMGYRMISNLAIVKWVFSPANVEQFHVSDRPWEILRNAVSKTYNRISDLRKEIQSLKKGLQVAKEASANAIRELEEAKSVLEIVEGQPAPAERPGRLRRLQAYADKAKQEEVSMEESLEAKGALLARALEESKELLKLLFKSFVDVLTERLPTVSADGEIPNLRAGDQNVNFAARDLETATMEIDNENGADKNSEPNGQNTKDGYNVGELEQWCLCTLGYLKSFSRQYATEIWSHIAMLDEEVFIGDIHPLIRKAASLVCADLPTKGLSFDF
ncbi:LOW QUALITY PROTEIN: nuclear cap-binding protein subunit 1 [Setaria italica]|uniref:LOW QUALITY PROTEIN: nuclear cap-binding protein subunit 1 n=1 Tax=Setaria italica TaxID=4555 RepID=UPI000350DCC7|nr:LOW QUALITY PROTEIN: nuclear cap-binding protein subunit 1 [Setaria italica]